MPPTAILPNPLNRLNSLLQRLDHSPANFNVTSTRTYHVTVQLDAATHQLLLDSGNEFTERRLSGICRKGKKSEEMSKAKKVLAGEVCEILEGFVRSGKGGGEGKKRRARSRPSKQVIIKKEPGIDQDFSSATDAKTINRKGLAPQEVIIISDNSSQSSSKEEGGEGDDDSGSDLHSLVDLHSEPAYRSQKSGKSPKRKPTATMHPHPHHTGFDEDEEETISSRPSKKRKRKSPSPSSSKSSLFITGDTDTDTENYHDLDEIEAAEKRKAIRRKIEAKVEKAQRLRREERVRRRAEKERQEREQLQQVCGGEAGAEMGMMAY